MPVANTEIGNDTNATVFNLTAGQQLLVTQPGFVYQLGTTGYAVDAASSAKITNYGVIHASTNAIRVTGNNTDTVNYGRIDGLIQYDNTTGTNFIDNYGTIAVRDGATAILGTSLADEAIRNFGTITGNVQNADFVVNRGTINGDVYSTSLRPFEFINRGGVVNGNVQGGNVDNVFDLIGGTVTGGVTGGRGNDQFLIDSSAATGLEILFDLGGSADVLNLSLATSAVWVDLMFTGIQVWTSGLGVATGANANTPLAYLFGIDSVFGTFGSDTFFGNNSDNTFTFAGIQPGTRDFFDGRGGSDTIDLYALPSVWVSLDYTGADVWTSNLTWSTGGNAVTALVDLVGVENIIGTSGADEVYGNAANNTFVSNGSAYTIGAFERFVGGAGSDTIDLSRGVSPAWVDLMFAGHQIWISTTTLYANGSTASTAFGDLVEVENVVGTASFSDYILGNAANNTYFFTGFHSATAETFDGRGGSDTFDASRSTYSVWINLEQSGAKVRTSFGVTSDGISATGDVAHLVSVENITGSGFNDTLRGDLGANRINGGAGTDSMRGSGGIDTFVVRQLAGTDTIIDFAANLGETIEISGFANRTTFAQVYANSVQNGANTEINLGFDPTNTVETKIILLDFTRTTLVADDFLFV